MLNIHSFLQGIKTGVNKYAPVKNLGTDSLKTCIIITVYSLFAIVLVLSSDSFYGNGDRTGTTFVKAQTVTNAYKRTEETAQDAQIQLDENQVKNVTLENKGAMFVTAKQSAEAFGVKKQVDKIISEKNKQNDNNQKKEELQTTDDIISDQRETNDTKKEESKAKEKETRFIKISDKEKKVLQRIVEAEATGEDIKGKMLVANVILNRVKSKKFPTTISGVVFQRSGSTYQFSPIKDGRYWKVKISNDTKKAVERVLSGEDKSQGALYFSARSKAGKRNMRWFDNNLTWLFKYGGHEFYK